MTGGENAAAERVPERDTFLGYVQRFHDFGHIVVSQRRRALR